LTSQQVSIFYFSNRKHVLIYSLEQYGIGDVDVMPVVLDVLEVDVVDVALVAGVMGTALGVVDTVVVVDVAVVHGCVSAKKTHCIALQTETV